MLPFLLLSRLIAVQTDGRPLSSSESLNLINLSILEPVKKGKEREWALLNYRRSYSFPYSVFFMLCFIICQRNSESNTCC